MTQQSPLNKRAGFTIIEVVITVGIVAILLAITFPFLLNMLNRFDTRSDAQIFVALLREAQSRSFANKYELNHGVYIADSEFVLFAGDSFSSRDESLDEEYARSSAVSVTGGTEYVFSRKSGKTDAQSTNFSSGGLDMAVETNSEGRINW